MEPEKHPYLLKSIQFIEDIGITVIEKELDDSTFLPGLMLGAGVIYVDYNKLKYPGDLLHEAGHIAVASPEERQLIGTSGIADTWPTQGDEMAAILWSFAAVNHLGLSLEFVFHVNGYKDSSIWFIDNFSKGNYMGLPLLQWFKMAYSNEEISKGKPPFPAMQHWVRQE